MLSAPLPRITVKAGRLRIAIPAASIRQIVPAKGIVRVPLTRPGVEGVVSRDGRAIPVYRMTSLMGGWHEETSAAGLTQIVILEHEGMLAGILVESAESARASDPAPARPVDGRELLSAAGIFDDETDGESAARAARGE